MSTLGLSREELALIVLYLNNAEARDKICRAIQYGSRFLSGGNKFGTAHKVDKNTSLARKVFRLLKFLNDFQDLITPLHKVTPLLLVLLMKSKNALSSTYLFLDQIVWLGKSGIYKNKERTRLIRRISLYSMLGSSICSTALEIHKLISLISSTKKMGKNQVKCLLYNKHASSTFLALVKSSMDVVVAIGVLKLAPRMVTPRVTGAFGFTTSIISCYQLLPSRLKVKKP